MLVFLALASVYALLQALRFAAAIVYLKRGEPGAAQDISITVMQPILSGDPDLGACLARNQLHEPGARFLMLIDADDADAKQLTAPLLSERTRTIVFAPPRQGENPKVAKLADALPYVETEFFAVLDDDTVLPPGALARAAAYLQHADLVTGLPLYAASGNFWSQLVAAFVNGASLITYPAAAAIGAQRTLNGMFYVGRCADLRALGGFEAIRRALTDDYAMAQLYLRAGKTLLQSQIIHESHTHVRDAVHYTGIMRRWMIFAMRYLTENGSVFTVGVIGLPVLLAPILILTGAMAGWMAFGAACLLLLTKAAVMALMRRVFAEKPVRLSELLLEPMADVLTPFHLVHAILRPRKFNWRSRSISMQGDAIHYE